MVRVWLLQAAMVSILSPHPFTSLETRHAHARKIGGRRGDESGYDKGNSAELWYQPQSCDDGREAAKRTTKESGDHRDNVFVVGYEGEVDTLIPHDYTFATRISAP